MLDNKDIKILDLLKENAKLSSYKIAKKTLIPITTVHNRIKKLEREGIIKGYTAVLDHRKLGYDVLAFMLITGDLGHLRSRKTEPLEVVNRLRKKEGVEEVHIITGQSDLLVKVRVKSMPDLSAAVRNIRELPGVQSTETILVLE